MQKIFLTGLLILSSAFLIHCSDSGSWDLITEHEKIAAGEPDDPFVPEEEVSDCATDGLFLADDLAALGGTVNGPTTTPGIVGTGYVFNGHDHYLRIPDSEAVELTNAGSIELWLYLTGHDHYAGLISKGELSAQTDCVYSLGLKHSTEELRFNLDGESGDWQELDSTAANQVPFNTWTHIVVTFDSTELVMYIDGAEINSTPRTVGAIKNNTAGVIIGAYFSDEFNASWGNLGYEGIIDGVNIYQRAITPVEVLANYEAAF
ncbi:MAG: LamG domain-containing protein [bacterium]|nr:LamG domain-containing protein [bacterium]